MNLDYKIDFILLTAALLFLSGCAKNSSTAPGSVEYGHISIEESSESPTEEYSPLLPIHIDLEVALLPEKEEGDFTVDDSHSILRIPGSRVIATYPISAIAVVDDEYTAIIKTDTESYYYIRRFYSNNYSDTLNISKYSGDVIRSLKFKSDGITYYGSRYDSGETSTIQDPVGEIVNELPRMTMTSSAGKRINPEISASYRFVGDDAYMVVGLSLTESADDLLCETYDIIRSIKPYIPAAETAEVHCIKPQSITETSKVSTPEGWNTTKKDGFIVCTPADNSSLYVGMEIYIFCDGDRKYCTDCLGMPTGIEELYIKHRYSTNQPYSFDTDITDFDEISEGGLDGYFYEITNNIYPESKQAVIDLPSCGTHLNSFACTFNDPNGLPFIIGVSYADKNRDQAFTLCKTIVETLSAVGY